MTMKACAAVLCLLIAHIAVATEAAMDTTRKLAASPFPVRGIVMDAPSPKDVPLMVRFVTNALPREGVNVLVMNINYRYQYTGHPEVVECDPLVIQRLGGPLSRSDLQAIAAACRAAGVRLIPQIYLLSHQGVMSEGRPVVFGLLRGHPEFDETPGKNPRDRSYCPLHPGLHPVAFDCMDELANVCGADAVHVGMDELTTLKDADCVRCGISPLSRTELFAREVNAVHDHLATTGREMWMWGDQFVDAATWKLNDWDGASHMGIAGALQMVSTNIVICDWHYGVAPPTANYFATNGFRVVSCPWKNTPVALTQLEMMRSLRANPNSAIAARGLGMLLTNWAYTGDYIRDYYGEGEGANAGLISTFKTLFQEIRDNAADGLAPGARAGAESGFSPLRRGTSR